MRYVRNRPARIVSKVVYKETNSKMGRVRLAIFPCLFDILAVVYMRLLCSFSFSKNWFPINSLYATVTGTFKRYAIEGYDEVQILRSLMRKAEIQAGCTSKLR